MVSGCPREFCNFNELVLTYTCILASCLVYLSTVILMYLVWVFFHSSVVVPGFTASDQSQGKNKDFLTQENQLNWLTRSAASEEEAF